MNETTGMLLVLSAILLLAGGCTASADRQEAIHERGSEVMPFDLDATTHVFDKTERGGLQQVVVKNANDSDAIALVRGHLHDISSEFAHGNFSDPRTLHGDSMPGVAVLEARSDSLNVTYANLSNGAQIMYRSNDADVVSAIHAWFDAQLVDHGDDASSAPASGECDEIPEGHDPELWRMHHGCA